MASISVNRILKRGLILSAEEIKQLTGWPDAMVQDYLNILDNLTAIASTLDEKNDIVKAVTTVDFSMSPYEIKDTDEEVFLILRMVRFRPTYALVKTEEIID